jgi:chemotaxis protein MotC
MLVCACSLSPAAKAEDAAPTPVELVSNLENTQGDIALGDASAYAAQPKILRGISDAFAKMPPDVWKNSRNARAAIVYLLSGGQPRIIVRLLDGGAIAKEDERLMRGALAYVLGQEAEALQLLGDVDPKSLDPALGGQIAFVQSILLTSVDAKKAIALLDLARLLMPGGLVEEAALRREVFLVSDGDRFLSLAGQYLNRFPKSPYADNFLKSFTGALIRLGLADDVANFPKLASVAEGLSRDDRRGLFLTIARKALVGGKIAMADVAASKALALAQLDSADETRGRLYQAAARTLTDQYDSAAAQLQAIDAQKLPKRDAPLLAAARSIAKRMRESMAAAPATEPPAGPDDPTATTRHLAEAALSTNQLSPSQGAP